MATRTRALTDTDLAYIAAVIDTRARIKLRTMPTGSIIPTIHLSTPDIELLRYIGDVTGVQPFVISRNYEKHRCTEHCPGRHEHVRSESARWSATGAKATVLLAGIQPFVRFQKQVIDTAIAVGLDAPFKMATVKKMAELGWTIPEELSNRT